jgi:hypothetical protein
MALGSLLVSLMFGQTLELDPPKIAPSQVAIRYGVRFDIGNDALCGMTEICDCEVTWEGGGRLRSVQPGALLYEGTWKQTGGRCHDALMLWSPVDGKAFHTIRLTSDGSAVTEWIAHARAEDTTRFTQDIKARGQVWVADFTAALDPKTHVATHAESDQQDVAGVTLASRHSLRIVFTP